MPPGKGILRVAVEDFFETFDFGKILFGWLRTVLERLEDEAIELYDRVAAESGLEPYLPGWLRKGSIFSRTPQRPIQLAPIIIGIIMMVVGALLGALAPAQRTGMYKIDRLLKTGRPDPLAAMQMILRFPQREDEIIKGLLDLGYSEEQIADYRLLSHQLLPAIELETLRRKGAITDEAFESEMLKAGYTHPRIDMVKALRDIIPTPNDLILMAVREAFDEGFIAQYRTDEDLPPDFVTWAAKQGLSEQWARRYWVAHWQLPSPQQVFEMLHRLRPGKSETPIIADDVEKYLKAADYSPFWRDKLQSISYSPFTRVDVRRMYKTGVLNEQQVKDAYLDLGYDDEHAQALTEFTIVYEAEEETGIVRSSVLSAYGDGMIDRSTAEGMLSSGGYDATTIGFYLDSADFQETLEVRKIKLANIKAKFLEGLLDETTVNNQINALNLPAERVTAMLELWVTQRENQTALLSIQQMEVLLERGIISQDEYKQVALKRGYTSQTIEWTLTRISQEAAERAQKEAEKAEADNERLQKSKTASKYQKDKSEVDLAIAQARAEITDIDVALHGEIDEQQAKDLFNRKDELKQFISQLNVTKAQLKFDTSTALDKLT